MPKPPAAFSPLTMTKSSRKSEIRPGSRSHTAVRPERPTMSPRKRSLIAPSTRIGAKRRNPLSVRISGMITSCHSSGTSGTSWQSKAMPISRGGAAGLDQPRDGAVVVAGAVADAVAAAVEGGERHQHERGSSTSASSPGPAVPNPMSTSGAPAHQFAKDDGRPCRGWPAGRAARRVRAAQTSAAARRPRSGSARSRRRSRRARRRSTPPPRHMPSEASMRQVSSSASRRASASGAAVVSDLSASSCAPR